MAAEKKAFDYVNDIWSIADYVRDVIRPADYNKLILPFADGEDKLSHNP